MRTPIYQIKREAFSMQNHFAKSWDYKLSIKRIFMDADDLPDASATVQMGKDVAYAVRRLASRVRDEYLRSQLEDCADNFDLEGLENDYEARECFNDALHSLYDVADAGKRVWIE